MGRRATSAEGAEWSASERERRRTIRGATVGARARRADRPGAGRRIWVIHGPNLNLLGERQPDIYGRASLAEIDAELERRAARAGAVVETFQSNVEGEIVTRIQHARGRADAIIINPAAYTHSSVAIRDALDAVGVPAIEVHLSNVHRREAFRRESITAPACVGQIVGFGPASYTLALQAALEIVNKES